MNLSDSQYSYYHALTYDVDCDITAHTVLLYVLFCLIYMYCTLYVLYILYTVHTVPCFPVSDVEVSSSLSVHHTCSLIYKFTLLIIVTKRSSFT